MDYSRTIMEDSLYAALRRTSLSGKCEAVSLDQIVSIFYCFFTKVFHVDISFRVSCSNNNFVICHRTRKRIRSVGRYRDQYLVTMVLSAGNMILADNHQRWIFPDSTGILHQATSANMVSLVLFNVFGFKIFLFVFSFIWCLK